MWQRNDSGAAQRRCVHLLRTELRSQLKTWRRSFGPQPNIRPYPNIQPLGGASLLPAKLRPPTAQLPHLLLPAAANDRTRFRPVPRPRHAHQPPTPANGRPPDRGAVTPTSPTWLAGPTLASAIPSAVFFFFFFPCPKPFVVVVVVGNASLQNNRQQTLNNATTTAYERPNERRNLWMAKGHFSGSFRSF